MANSRCIVNVEHSQQLSSAELQRPRGDLKRREDVYASAYADTNGLHPGVRFGGAR